MVLHTDQPKDQHSFLLEEGIWEAEGRGYIPSDGREAKISGRTTVRHPASDRITNEGWMRVHVAPIAFEVWQRFEFRPSDRPHIWNFVSQNDRVGELTVTELGKLTGSRDCLPDDAESIWQPHSGTWQTASTLLPSGSRTKAP